MSQQEAFNNEIARDSLHSTGQYKVVGGIISPVSDLYSHKNLASAHHRCAMVRLAVQSSDWIRLDTWESEQSEWLETVKVLRHHQGKLSSMTSSRNSSRMMPTKKRKVDLEAEAAGNADGNDNESIQIKLLCGSDVLESFAIPGLWTNEDMEEITQNYGMVIISRAGNCPEKFIYESDILTKHKNNILIVREWITNEISATKIRTAIRRGQSVKYLVQDSVIDYIAANSLYNTSALLSPNAVNNNTTAPAADTAVTNK